MSKLYCHLYVDKTGKLIYEGQSKPTNLDQQLEVVKDTTSPTGYSFHRKSTSESIDLGEVNGQPTIAFYGKYTASDSDKNIVIDGSNSGISIWTNEEYTTEHAYDIYMDYDNKVYVKISSSAIYGPVTTTDTWYHVLSQTKSAVYINGTDQTAGLATSSDSPLSTVHLYLLPSSTNTYIDDLIICDYPIVKSSFDPNTIFNNLFVSDTDKLKIY